jgi:hypothetical protein
MDMIGVFLIGAATGAAITMWLNNSTVKRSIAVAEKSITNLMLTRKEMGRLGNRIGSQRRKIRTYRDELKNLRPAQVAAKTAN